MTRTEKRHSQKISRVRVRVEHSLSGVKRARAVKDVLRNTKDGFSDLIILIACGLHNLRVQFRKRALHR